MVVSVGSPISSIHCLFLLFTCTFQSQFMRLFQRSDIFIVETVMPMRFCQRYSQATGGEYSYLRLVSEFIHWRRFREWQIGSYRYGLRVNKWNWEHVHPIASVLQPDNKTRLILIKQKAYEKKNKKTWDLFRAVRGTVQVTFAISSRKHFVTRNCTLIPATVVSRKRTLHITLGTLVSVVIRCRAVNYI